MYSFFLFALVMLQTPEGFGCVEPDIYRATRVEAASLPFLATLDLKMIVFMNPERPSKSLQEFASSNNIQLVHTGLQPWKAISDWKLTSKGILQDILKYLLDSRNSPILLLDTFNFFVGILRKIQQWSFAAIISEYKMYTGAAAHYKTETFLEILRVRCIEHDAVDIKRQNSMPLITLTGQDADSRATVSAIDQLVTLILPPWENLPYWFRWQWKLLHPRAELDSESVFETPDRRQPDLIGSDQV